MLVCPSSILFTALFFVAATSALPGQYARRGSDSECSTGSLQCCDQVMDSSSSSARDILSALGISLDSVYGLVGSGCSPITVIGAGSGAACTQQPLCCAKNADNGLVNYDCSPVDITL